MYPTFHAPAGQRVYARITQDISRGDIVLYRKVVYPCVLGNSPVQMKRVIALGGDTIEFRQHTKVSEDFRFGLFWIYINGEFLDESEYLAPFREHEHGYTWTSIGFWLYEGFTVSDGGDNFLLVIPQGYFFVMGDNRGDSLDSRHEGPIPMENLYGIFVER